MTCRVALRRRAAPPSSGWVAPPARTTGQPLPAPVRADLEGRLGHDLSKIRIHAGSEADASARSLSARAYTVGRDLAFRGDTYRPDTAAGRHLLAHEAVHAIQQGATTPLPGHGSAVTLRSGPRVARALDYAAIRADIEAGRAPPSADDVAGHGAAYPGSDGRAAATKATVPTDSDLPIRAYYFRAADPTVTTRALVHGGIHGTEIPSYEIGDEMVTRLAATPPAVHTLLIPRVNPGGIADRSRCNRQEVDLNRNFAGTDLTEGCRVFRRGGFEAYREARSGDTHCGCGSRRVPAPEQPETTVVKEAATGFAPHRMLALHAHSDRESAGVFADPATDAAAQALALDVARALPEDLRPGNVGGNAAYEEPTTEGSFGYFGPSDLGTPVLTLETPRYHSLSRRRRRDSADRTLERYVPAVERFLGHTVPDVGTDPRATPDDDHDED